MLLAVAGGIQLGESTIGMINPVHFQGPAIHPRDRGAAIDESQFRPSERSFASFYGWDEGESARLEDCGDCEAITARDSHFDFSPTPVTIHRATVEQWDEPVSDHSDDSMGGPEESLDDLDTELEARIVRYAYYEIESSGDSEDLYSDGE